VCGDEVEDDEQQCPNCMKAENKFQVLTLAEKLQFNGVTLEQGSEQQGENEFYNANQRIYSGQFNVINTGFFTKLILGIAFLGLLCVALPVVLLVISIVSFTLFFFRK
jgi:hypothetical protein